MEQYRENQYDDDLTVGTDEYDESYYTGADDLFAFSADEESPISRLKSLILSIDWEITDEILLQFNEELLDLRDIWAGEKINLVYVQALEKISKYIYHKKADSHPNAIKLLLTLYHNLEKIVSTPDLSDDEKNEILTEDIKRFDSLKKVIGGKVQGKEKIVKKQVEKQPEQVVQEIPEGAEELLNLKAIVLGIDWEITDKDLEALKQEVVRLEKLYAHSRPRLIFLQGIGTLGAYIKLKKSDAHADAFKVLHIFYEGLEKIVIKSMSLEEEKEILFPAVEMFNSFKTVLGPTISPEAITRAKQEHGDGSDDGYTEGSSGEIVPAFSDLPEEETAGFQAEEEAKDIGIGDFDNVDTHVEGFFSDASWEEAETTDALQQDFLQDEADPVDELKPASISVDKEVALQGVHVEEDEEDTPAQELPAALEAAEELEQEVSPKAEIEELQDDQLETVLAESETLGFDAEPEETIALPADSIDEPGKLEDTMLTEPEGDQEDEMPPDAGIDEKTEESLLDSDSGVDLEDDIVLPGVDVDTEADDDSDEEPLPFAEGDLAPALALAEDEDLGSREEMIVPASDAGQTEEEILSRIDGFFGETEQDISEVPVQAELQEQPEALEPPEIAEEPGVSVEPEELELSEEPDELELSAELEELEVTAELEELEVPAEPAALHMSEEIEEPGVSEEPEEVASFIDYQELEDTIKEEDVDSMFDTVFSEETLSEEVSLEENVDMEEALEVETQAPSFEEEKQPLETQLEDESAHAETEQLFEQPEENLELEENLESFFAGSEQDEPEELELEEQKVEDGLFPDDTGEELTQPEDDGVAPEELVETISEDLGGAEADDAVSPAQVISSVPPFKLSTPKARQKKEMVAEPVDETPMEVISDEIVEGVDDVLELETPAFDTADSDEEVVFELVEDPEPSVAEDFDQVDADDEELLFDQNDLNLESLSPLAALELCIDSLEVEIDDKVIHGLYEALEELRQGWGAAPLEETFLQLLTTVTQHIDKYRYEASEGAIGLLRSISEALHKSELSDGEAKQGLLLAETTRVLSWQQAMLDRQSIAKGETLTFVSPLRGDIDESVDAKGDFEQAFLDLEGQELEPGEYEQSEAKSQSENDLLGSEGSENSSNHEPAAGNGLMASDTIKSEIGNLRETLQKEIAELKKSMKADK